MPVDTAEGCLLGQPCVNGSAHEKSPRDVVCVGLVSDLRYECAETTQPDLERVVEAVLRLELSQLL